MAILAAASASIRLPSSSVPSLRNSQPPVALPFRFDSATHRALSHSAPPRPPLAISRNTAAESVAELSLNNRTKPIVVIDNYDSFTYNLCQYMGELGCEFEVFRNDELTVDDLKEKNPRGILISPGPGTPQDSGISLQTVLELGPTVPVFGVCMGLQCIGEAFGGKIVRAPYGVMHGKSSPVYYNETGEDGLFAGLSNPFTAGRYHSLVIEKESFPSDVLEITAWTENGLIMGARHKVHRHLQGVQFHPESIITSEGKTIVRNFIKLIERNEGKSKH
ncbi:anthranilate synthase beta subunit 2, chloroplastic-like [Salvia hispanica]|uniref:anthranilate synthase beta subunit 2, chloroplastic-like n=1 Tax=Salvia hispanica TaxID=49212 RepID=UPI0020095A73|nr:anthranilate synthase beta subunit 2, chloroplastic-like [Salvia hispanica]